MLQRLSRVQLSEIGWRSRVSARIAWDRLQAARSTPAWDRAALGSVLTPHRALDEVRACLRQKQWTEAHQALCRHFQLSASRRQRFPLAPANRPSLAATIRERFPAAATNAATRADRIVAGLYDLLGYRGLTFGVDGQGAAAIDWQRDPVHARRAPSRRFWSQVPYLNPACGDHKIIWELNRHQHWLVLGRAYWLTGDARYRKRCIDELVGWLVANPPLMGINWASMLELALRSLSWLWLLAFAGDDADGERPWVVDLLIAIDRQLTHVERNLSYYFSPNTHLLGEALALYVAGRTLPQLARSRRRQSIGRRVLIEEMARQIARDGGHCERSTHYHRYTLDFYLLALIVARTTGDAAADRFETAVSRLAGATRMLADDHGRLPHIGDDDGGMLFPIAGRSPDDVRDSLAVAAVLLGRPDLQIGPVPEEAHWLLAHPQLFSRLNRPQAPDNQSGRSGALTDTGYYVSRSARGDHLVVDAGAHGYLNGGHAHADALSLTLTVAGEPLLVDPGTGSYTEQKLRDRLRSSQLHNTLVIDGRSQSISRGPFSWTHTANGRMRRWRTHESFDFLEGEHDGYAPLGHRRHVLVLRSDLCVVLDLLRGSGTHTAAVHWHVDPRWRVMPVGRAVTFVNDDRCCQLVVPAGQLEVFTADGDTGLGWQAPVYGLVEPATSLRITQQGAFPFWMASVLALSSTNPIEGVTFAPVSSAAGTLEHGVTLRIARRASLDFVALAEARTGQDAALWRFGDFETDAGVAFCRLVGGQLAEVAMVDGSVFRNAAQPASRIAVPHRVPALHVHLLDTTAAVSQET